MKRLLMIAFSSLMVFSAQITLAESRALSAVQRSALIIKQQTKTLKTNAKKLKGAEKTKANRVLLRQLVDRDDDGVPDQLEDSYGTNACDATSDGEHRDGDKREREGSVTATDGGSITVGGLQFVLNDQTILEELEIGDLVVGACVSVEGFIGESGVVTATKVEAHGRCRGSSSSRSSSSSSSSSSESDD